MASLHIDGNVAALAFLFLLVLLAVIGGVVLYAVFLSPKNEGRYKGILGELYDFLNFRKLIIEGVLRFLYVIAACVTTVYGIIQIFLADTFAEGLLYGLGFAVLGNLALRIAFELVLMFVLICRNLIEINQKLRPRTKRGPDSLKDAPRFSLGIMPKTFRSKLNLWAKNAVGQEHRAETGDEGQKAAGIEEKNEKENGRCA